MATSRGITPALDGLPKERLSTGRVAALTEQDVDDHAILVDRTVQVELVSLAEQEDLVNGLITSDKFCVTRHAVLRLSWPRRRS